MKKFTACLLAFLLLAALPLTAFAGDRWERRAVLNELQRRCGEPRSGALVREDAETCAPLTLRVREDDGLWAMDLGAKTLDQGTSLADGGAALAKWLGVSPADAQAALAGIPGVFSSAGTLDRALTLHGWRGIYRTRRTGYAVSGDGGEQALCTAKKVCAQTFLFHDGAAVTDPTEVMLTVGEEDIQYAPSEQAYQTEQLLADTGTQASRSWLARLLRSVMIFLKNLPLLFR